MAGMAALGAGIGLAGSMLSLLSSRPNYSTTASPKYPDIVMLGIEGDDLEMTTVEVEPVKKAVPVEPVKKAVPKVRVPELDAISRTIAGFLDVKDNENLAKLASPRARAAALASATALVSRPALAVPNASPWATSTFYDALDNGLVEKVSFSPNVSDILVSTKTGTGMKSRCCLGMLPILSRSSRRRASYSRLTLLRQMTQGLVRYFSTSGCRS
jgi:hypothetical protein